MKKDKEKKNTAPGRISTLDILNDTVKRRRWGRKPYANLYYIVNKSDEIDIV